MSSPAFSFDETRVYSAMCRSVYCLDAATGSRIRTFTPPDMAGDFRATPAVDDQGNVYVGSMNGSVYAIRSDATGLLPNAGSPRFHGGNASTGRRE